MTMSDPEQARPIPEPIAIIGIGCQYPGGATSPTRFWELLRSGTDATREVPSDRWDVGKFYDPDARKSGKMQTFRGGYLDRIDRFDAHFFGISPREAIWLDPQQRLLLQVLWEALEDGGQVAEGLRGSDTGVFIGGFTLDYQLLQNYGVLSRYELQANSATGMMMTMLANRLSYVFDFRGPSMAVDTACSGSLVAVHLAARSIWSGECSMAVAGGSNMMIAPTMTIAESKGGFLAPDGRCKTFDASADGYARGEGAGVVVLKALSRAVADRDPIYALVRGTAVSQDGHTTGITVPNGEAQEAAMRAAYRMAGIAPADVGYVEAHGTGTPVGDPVEARAIGRVMSQGRDVATPCRVGSVKTNIGHLEAAAGVAGLTKAALALRYETIPPHLNLDEPNPEIPFEELRLRVPTSVTPWPRGATPRYAGVNSFGFGGTNAHVVLEEAPVAVGPVTHPELPGPALLALSARSGDALAELARSYRDQLAAGDHDLRDVGWSAALRRDHHEHRLAVVADSGESAVGTLNAYLDDARPALVASGRVPAAGPPRIAFVCSGMGPQWWAMGRELLEHEPVFRAEIERCDAEFTRHLGWSLLAAMTASCEDSRMDETEVAQPANFAIQVALAALWRSWGVEPDAIVGHSTGEVAAQYLSGVLSFEDAVKVCYYRSTLQQRTTGAGRMLAVGMTPETLEQAVSDAGPLVSVAAINSPSAVTLAGDAAILEDMARQLETFGVFHRFLTVKVPYHSHFMDPLRDDLLAGLADLEPRQARIPLYSTVTGTRIAGSGVDAHYWWQNMRGTVLFSAAFTQMVSDGHTVFVEIGPHPVLSGAMKELLGLEGQDGGVVVPSLRRLEPEQPAMMAALGSLYTLGHPVNWDVLYEDGGNLVPLPGYPWQLESYWTESHEAHQDRHYTPAHPLLGQRLDAAQPTWELEMNTHRLPYLADHRVQDNLLVPGAAFIEMALAAAAEEFGGEDVALENVTFDNALVLTESSDPRVRTVLQPDGATVEISSYRPGAGNRGRWTVHATARLRRRQAGGPGIDTDAVRRGATVHLDHDTFYARTAGMGFQYGPAFRTVRSLDSGPDGVAGLIVAPDEVSGDLADYHVHPSLLDAGFQVLLTAADPGGDQERPAAYLPVGLDRIRVLAPPRTPLSVVARIVSADERQIVSDIRMFDDNGDLVVDIEGFRARSLDAAAGLSLDRIDRALHQLEWRPQPRAEQDPAGDDSSPDGPPAGPGTWLIMADTHGVAEQLAQRLVAAGGTAVTVLHGEVDQPMRPAGQYLIDLRNPDHFRQLVATLPGREGLTQVVHLSSLDAAFTDDAPLSVLEADQHCYTQSVVHLMQALAGADWSDWPRIWLVTRRAQHVEGHPGPLALAQAPLWGMGRVIGHQEFTSMWGGLVDLDTGPVDEQAELLLDEILHRADEDQIAFRDGERHVLRLAACRDLRPALPPSVRPDGSYLVTGGLGALGLLVARFLVDSGATRLVLMGRTELPGRAEWHKVGPDHPQWRVIAQLRDLERRGASIHLAAVDVADEAQLRGWVERYKAEAWPPIRGVLHVAGLVADELLLRMGADAFQRVLRPKVQGGWLLHTMLRDQPLDFFVLFSSTGSTIASAGQTNYAAANAFLDLLAHHRRQLGLPAVSIGWGPWSVGMVEELGLEQFYAGRGIDLITPETGARILGRLVGQAPAHVVAISVDWATARATSPSATLPSMFAELGLGADGDVGTNPADGVSMLATLAESPPAERAGLISAHLRTLVARVLQLDESRFTEDDPLTALGLDSMMAVELKQRIDAALQVDVSVLELLQGATTVELTARIAGSLTLPSAPAADDTVEEGGTDTDPAPDGDAALLDELDRLLAQVAAGDIEALLDEMENDTNFRNGGQR